MKMLLGIKRTGKMEARDGASTRGQRVHRRIRWPQQSNAGTEAPYSEAEGGGGNFPGGNLRGRGGGGHSGTTWEEPLRARRQRCGTAAGVLPYLPGLTVNHMPTLSPPLCVRQRSSYTCYLLIFQAGLPQAFQSGDVSDCFFFNIQCRKC